MNIERKILRRLGFVDMVVEGVSLSLKNSGCTGLSCFDEYLEYVVIHTARSMVRYHFPQVIPGLHTSEFEQIVNSLREYIEKKWRERIYRVYYSRNECGVYEI